MYKLRADKQTRLVVMLMSASFAFDVVAATSDEQLVDPTAPLGVAIATGETGDGLAFGLSGEILTTYELSSVLIRAQDRIAVINGQRARIGDKVGSAVVMSIDPSRVTLNVDGEARTLELYANSIKTLVKGDE